MGLTQLWGLEITDAELFSVAATIGSDVPFFLLGGTALGVGRGEEVYPLEDVAPAFLLLANPGLEISTADAYAGLARLTTPKSGRMIPFTLLAAKGIRAQSLLLRNDLEEVVFVSHPEVEHAKRDLLLLGARSALMSGSGATVYGVFERSEDADRAIARLREKGLWAEIARTVDRGEYLQTIGDTGE
jgi:4-diphosphocytidyl-2-C-methyl-D-erythritol kinase